jgi:DNA-binding beta-propeller fold protein YncE/mono/diheme cytochrome c family protein
MKNFLIIILSVLLSACNLFKKESGNAPVDMFLHDGNLFVAEESGQKITIIELEKNKITRSIHLGFKPSAMGYHEKSGDILVCGGGCKGKLARVNIPSGKIIYSSDMQHTPSGLAIDQSKNIIYVTNRFSNNIQMVDLSNGNILKTIPCIREPIAVTLAGKNNQYLLVGNHLPYARGTDKNIASKISVYDAVTGESIKDISLPNGSLAVKSVAMSNDNKLAYFTHSLARYTMPTTQVERGWMNTAALSIINCESLLLYETILLDDMEQGFANPWDISISKTGTLAVSSFGTDEVIILNEDDLRNAILSHQKTKENGEKPGEGFIPNLKDHLSFCANFSRRVQCTGRGARTIALSENQLFVGMYYSDNINCINLSTENIFLVRTKAKQNRDKAREGEALFNDAKMCLQRWQSCGSCHPDARIDGVSWDLLNDGMGNHKNTHSLLFSHETPPVMSRGIRDKAETAVRAGMHHIQFIERPEKDAELIDYYLKNLKPVQSPYRNRDGSLTEEAKRGKEIFKKVGCASCHSGSYYTDGTLRNVRTGTGEEKDEKFDTPTLIELWRTAPYLHDGRALTIKEAITKYNHGNIRGNTQNLSEEELNDLIEFLQSL